jgi:hypothetical protein
VRLSLLIVRQRSATEIFSFIYKDHVWGNATPRFPFNSGPGSHDVEIVEPYVSAVRSFIADTFSTPPDVVDLGCGDFNVGRQIRNVTDRYIASDIVSDLIEHNRLSYAGEDVDFRVLDIISEDLPPGDIVFIRQVLQHLGNDQISRFLPKLRHYPWAIITEHIPSKDPFIPNHDIRTGAVRLGFGSGVELTEAPFNLIHYSATILCELYVKSGRIRTTVYQIRK